MVLLREEQRPPLSLILPHLYLGAERDVTQDSLSARGISHVLSVSRCSPQPAFLPAARFLRVPIDDSLRDDLLPWIPAALRFIDGAVSSGSAVLVHCAAGISRSPALAVAYIMYSMGLDLDHAYRFVKERRPSISPNFNFLGQLQHFQGSLRQKSSDGRLIIRPLDSPDAHRPSPSPLPSPGPRLDHQGKPPPAGDTGAVGVRGGHQTHADEAAARCSRLDEAQKDPSAAAAAAARSLNRKLQTLNLTLNLSQRVPTHGELPSPLPRHEATTPGGGAPPGPPQPPAARASLLEKRRSLTLSLSPTVPAAPPHLLALSPHSHHQAAPHPHRSHPAAAAAAIPGGQTVAPVRGVAPVAPAALEARGQRQRGSSSSSSSSCRKTSRPSRGTAPPGGGVQVKGAAGVCAPRQAQNPLQRGNRRKDVRKGGEASQRQLNTTTTTTSTTTIVDQQPSAEAQKTPPRCLPEEYAAEEQSSPLSPLSLTLSKVLGWGERVLLGVLLGPHVKVGQAALPYRC